MIIRASAVLFALASLSLAQNRLTPDEQKEHYQLLFDGSSLKNWQVVKRRPNNSTWTVTDGVLSYEKGESWLGTDDTYSDFVLRLDYKTAEKCDSGIFINAAGSGNPGNSGLEFNIISDSGQLATNKSTFSVWSIVAPSKNLNKPDGEWNSVEISVINRHLTATLNGEKVQDVNLDDPQYPALATRGKVGHIGLQAHAFGEPASFRNIRIKPIKTGPPDPFAPPQAAPAK
jgi:hypothetical protein